MINVICAIKVEKRTTVKISRFVQKRAAQKFMQYFSEME